MGMFGGVPMDEVTETGAQVQSLQHVRGEPPQQHTLLQVHGFRVTVPAGFEDLDRNREAVDARFLFQRVRRQALDLKAGNLLGEFPP